MNWSKTRVIVTGGAGFIGTHLTKRLLELNTEVIVVDNFSTGTKTNLSFFDGEIINSNVNNPSLLNKIKHDVDYIFHFGAPSSVVLFNRDPVKCFNETCGGLLNIMTIAKEKTVKKVVFPSSGSVYGKTPPPQKENDPPLTVNLYGVAKLTCERIAQHFSKDIETVGLRIFAGYGPNETHKGEIASPVSLFLGSISKNERPVVFGDGTQSRDFIYIDSIIDAIISSVGKKVPPIINIGSGIPWTFNHLIDVINEFLETDIKPVFIPKPSTYLEQTKADTTLMEKDLQIEPIQPKDGLKRYLEVEKLS